MRDRERERKIEREIESKNERKNDRKTERKRKTVGASVRACWDIYLNIATAGTQETEHSRCDRHGGEQAEATRLPHLLHIMVPLEIHSDTMHSVAGRSGLGLAPSRGSALPV